MLQHIIDKPWPFVGLLLVLLLLNAAAAVRIRHDRKLRQRRANRDRREKPRSGPDRRWQPRPPKG